MGQCNRRRKLNASHAMQARHRKRQRMLRNCSNCKRTELHQHDESLSLTSISESDIQQNKKGKFSMLAGECWDDCHLCLECWKVGLWNCRWSCMAIFCLENPDFYHTRSEIIILVIHARRLEVMVAAKGKMTRWVVTCYSNVAKTNDWGRYS